MGPGVLNKMLSKLPKFTDDNVLVGFETNDDAAVYKIGDNLAAIQTVDFFPPMIDEPFTYGRISAANALSDIYAMGAKPSLAMNLLCFNSKVLPLDIATEILAGGADAVMEAGAVIVGGQSIEDPTPKYGLCVTAFAPIDRILTNSGAKEGDAIILTKAIGTALMITAMKGGMANPNNVQIAIDQMCRLNKYAAEAIAPYDVHACTDVTGFGLVGHLMEMAKSSGLSAVIAYSKVPKLPDVETFVEFNCIPCEGIKNKGYLSPQAELRSGVTKNMFQLLCDPQTSGGLLISLPENQAESALECIRQHDPEAAVIGYMTAKQKKPVIIEP